MSTVIFSLSRYHAEPSDDVEPETMDQEAEPQVFQAQMVSRARLQAHVVTPIPEALRQHLVGERPWRDVPAELAELVGPRTQTLTAIICAAVAAAPDGYSAAEMLEALHQAGVEAVRLNDTVKAALSFQAKEGRLNRHLEVVQERCAGHNDDILRTITVYTKPKAAGAFEAYGGFRDPDCPKCFRGEILTSLIFPAAAADFVRRIKGPITATPAFKQMQSYALEWLYGKSQIQAMERRCQQARRGICTRSAIFS